MPSRKQVIKFEWIEDVEYRGYRLHASAAGVRVVSCSVTSERLTELRRTAMQESARIAVAGIIRGERPANVRRAGNRTWRMTYTQLSASA